MTNFRTPTAAQAPGTAVVAPPNALQRADVVYVGYAKYRQRITERAVPVFVLEPV